MSTKRSDSIFSEEDRKAEIQRLAACICARDKTTIQCTQCGNLSFGRLFRVCPTHPNVVFLYDLRTCPMCQGSQKGLEELPIDHRTYQKIARLNTARSS